MNSHIKFFTGTISVLSFMSFKVKVLAEKMRGPVKAPRIHYNQLTLSLI